MRRRRRPAWPALAGACLVAACAGTGASAPPVDTTLTAAGELRGYDRATLELGRRHYVGECARCHSAVAPTAYSETEWIAILQRMTKKSALSATDMAAVKAYVLSAIDAAHAPVTRTP